MSPGPAPPEGPTSEGPASGQGHSEPPGGQVLQEQRPARPPVAPSPTGPRSCLGSFWALLGVLVGGLYILNPGLGLLELLPDNLPGFGNLDEAGAAALLIFGLRYLLGRRR